MMRRARKEVPGLAAREVLGEIKRSSGLCVTELAGRLGLSYMGAKQHCLKLEKLGFLTSRNQHHEAGRPRLVYRLSQRGQDHFSAPGQTDPAVSLLLQARLLFGALAPGKLLYLHFRALTQKYAAEIPASGTLEDRLNVLAGLRERDGCMACVEGAGLLVEYHCPWSGLFAEFPEAMDMEEAMISEILGAKMLRRIVGTKAHYKICFEAFDCGGGGILT